MENQKSYINLIIYLSMNYFKQIENTIRTYKKQMNILGIHLGHNSTAAIVVDGKIINCISEERFTRIKNDCGFPKKAVEWILEENNLQAGELDLVCVVNDSLKDR